MTEYPPPPPPRPGPGGAYPPPPPGYGQPQAPRKKPIYKKWWFWVGVVIVLAIIGSALPKDDKGKDGDSSTPPAAASQPAADPTTSAAPTTSEPETSSAPEPSTSAPAPKPSTVLDVRGNGIKDTKSFSVDTDEWDINYTFDCSSFGQSGVFQIYLYKGNDDLVNIVANSGAKQGKDTTTQRGSGKYYLKVNSVCDWTVKVVTSP